MTGSPFGPPATAPPPPATPRRAPIGLILVAVLLAVGTLAALATGGVALLLPGGSTRAGSEWPGPSVRQATQAASDCVTEFLTVSADTVGDDLDQVLGCSTGTFRSQYESGMAEVREAVLDNAVSATGTVLRTAVVSADADTVVVLVAVDAEIRNRRTPDGRQAHYRVRVAMSPVKGRWLVSQLEFVS
ncbi:MAG: hypothetical protein ACRDT6_09015 [Micromonosporaceae bacterium]